MWEVLGMHYNRFELPLMHSVDKGERVSKLLINTAVIKMLIIWHHDQHVVNKALHTGLLFECRLHTFLELRECVDSIETYKIVPYDCKACVNIIVRVTGWKACIKKSTANSFLD